MQKYTITITLEEDETGQGYPELKIKAGIVEAGSNGLVTGQFALMAKTFKDLTLASMEVHLQVASDLSITAQKASDAGAFDEDA